MFQLSNNLKFCFRFHCMYVVGKTEGIRGLYKGNRFFLWCLYFVFCIFVTTAYTFVDYRLINAEVYANDTFFRTWC